MNIGALRRGIPDADVRGDPGAHPDRVRRPDPHAAAVALVEHLSASSTVCSLVSLVKFEPDVPFLTYVFCCPLDKF